MNTTDPDGLIDFFPHQYLRRIFKWWWLLAVLCILGGLIGFLISKWQGGIYESNTVITTAIDYAYSNRLDDAEEDHLLTAIGNLIGSTTVMDSVMEKVNDRGIQLTRAQVEDALSLSRMGFSWSLSSRSTDPVIAQTLAEIWLESAFEELFWMQQKALEGLQKLGAQNAYEDCLSQSIVLEPVSYACNLNDLQTIRAEIDQIKTSDSQRGLLLSVRLSRITFEVTQFPQEPLTPVLFHANFSTFLGSTVGLILTLAFFLTGRPR